MGSDIFLEKNKNRCIASILNRKEQEVDFYLPDEVSASLRSVILDEINAYHLIVLEVLNGKVNPDFMDMLQAIHDKVVSLEG